MQQFFSISGLFSVDNLVNKLFCPLLVSEESTADKDGRSSNSLCSCHPGILARFLSLSGHVALRHMVHLDVSVLGEIKRRQIIEENDKEKEKQANKSKGTGSESCANSTKVV